MVTPHRSLHVVWDWNGTLLDDFEIVVTSVTAAVARLGRGPITPDDYRTHYGRPVIGFYNRLLGRDLTQPEWDAVNDAYFDSYEALVGDAQLTVDAVDALEMVDATGGSQSLLSMWYHDRLVPAATGHGVADHMVRIDGVSGDTADTKVGHLLEHLHALGRTRVVVVGDALDDAVAADRTGVPAVLYDGGSHHRHELEASGAPVASSLIEAVTIATDLW